MTAQRAPLHGLVLAGGASRRMGRDKASLSYHGKPQLEWARELLTRHCAQVFVSIRADQADDPLRRDLPAIVDTHDGIGPIAGVAAAQAAYPDHAWLVLACDLPFVTDASVEELLRHRDGRAVVAFRSEHDGLPEPLCAIYEPQTRAAILEQIAAGRHCPRKFVIGTNVALLEQPQPTALDNVNTPDELQRARTALAATAPAPAVEQRSQTAPAATSPAPAGEQRSQATPAATSPAPAGEVGRMAG